MRKFLIILLVGTSFLFSNCTKDKDEPDPAVRLLALQYFLTK